MEIGIESGIIRKEGSRMEEIESKVISDVGVAFGLDEKKLRKPNVFTNK